MTSTILRHPAVAGRFYPGDPDDLRAEALGYLSQSISSTATATKAIGCIAPHAGYMYSGHVAGAVFGQIEIPAALRGDVSEPHGHGSGSGDDERRLVGDAVGRSSDR